MRLGESSGDQCVSGLFIGKYFWSGVSSAKNRRCQVKVYEWEIAQVIYVCLYSLDWLCSNQIQLPRVIDSIEWFLCLRWNKYVTLISHPSIY